MIKAKEDVGILKRFPKFLPLKTLDQMHKVLVPSHRDCDIIYHIPSKPPPSPLGRTLNTEMEEVERIQYQSTLGRRGAVVKGVEHISTIVLVNI